MNYILFDHQLKSRTFSDTLALYGHNPIPRLNGNYHDAGFVLTDNAVLSRQRKLEELRRRGMNKFFIYPHAGRPSLVSAFYQSWPHITAEFVSTKGHMEVMLRAGNINRLYAIGWSLCPLREFQTRERVYNVLFAPIHPRNSEIDRKINSAVLDKLYPLVKNGKIHLTVRYLSPFEGNGIKRYEGVEYVEGSAGPVWNQIDAADLVISHQTFAFIAVARGIPTLMMGEDIKPHVEYRNGGFLEANDWEKYRDLIMYPLDILYSDAPMDMMEKAAKSDEAIRGWRNRMIGNRFDAGEFMEILGGYL